MNHVKFIRKMIIALLLMPVINFAAVPTWKVLPAESQLTFSATQNDAPVTGEFKRFTGKIQFDRDNLAGNQVDIIVDTGSLSTSYGDLTTTLLTPDWLSTKIFPTAEFKAIQFKKNADNSYLAIGTLKIRDKVQPIMIHFSEEATDNKDKVRVKGSTTLKRTAFGVGQGEWASTKEVKDAVTVNFVVTAIKQ